MSAVRTIDFVEHNVTNVHPLAVGLLAGMSALVFAPKRSAATFALLTICLFLPLDQRVVIAGLDFSMLRLISIVAVIRVLIRGEHHGLNFGKIDRLFVFWVVSASLFHVLRVGPSGIVYRLGVSFDALVSFFLFRALVRQPADVYSLWKQVAWLVLALVPFLIYEAATQHNVFGIFRYGGWDLAPVRDGEVRAAGPFSHPILAGTFGSVSLPVFFGAYRGRKSTRLLFGAACVGATIMTITSGSSGPVFAWATSALGWWLWRRRRHMRRILWAGVGIAVVLHFVREKPVWHLIARVSSITGGGGYHRYKLIDNFINRFTEWALVGTSNTAHWGWGLQDTTNQYVEEGINGGIVTLVLFIMLLRVGFLMLRATRLVFERSVGPTSLSALLAWGCSVSLAADCVSFISVSYFGQMQSFFFFFIATIPAFARFRRPQRAASQQESRNESAPAPSPMTGVRPTA